MFPALTEVSGTEINMKRRSCSLCRLLDSPLVPRTLNPSLALSLSQHTVFNTFSGPHAVWLVCDSSHLRPFSPFCPVAFIFPSSLGTLSLSCCFPTRTSNDLHKTHSVLSKRTQIAVIVDKPSATGTTYIRTHSRLQILPDSKNNLDKEDNSDHMHT